MTDEGVRHFFAGIPGMHGHTEAALSGWSGTVRILPAGAVLAVGDFMICGGEPGEHGRQTLACMMAEQPREWLLYVPGKWKALLDGLGTFRPVTRQGFQLLRPDAIREDLAAWKSLHNRRRSSGRRPAVRTAVRPETLQQRAESPQGSPAPAGTCSLPHR